MGDVAAQFKNVRRQHIIAEAYNAGKQDFDGLSVRPDFVRTTAALRPLWLHVIGVYAYSVPSTRHQ